MATYVLSAVIALILFIVMIAIVPLIGGRKHGGTYAELYDMVVKEGLWAVFLRVYLASIIIVGLLMLIVGD